MTCFVYSFELLRSLLVISSHGLVCENGTVNDHYYIILNSQYHNKTLYISELGKTAIEVYITTKA